MSYFSNNPIFKEVIITVANGLKKNPILIEKDLVQSFILLELSKSDLPLVFKGGTSLSKVYNLIDRFSEDIDLSASRKVTNLEKRQIKELIINSCNKYNLKLLNKESIKTRYDYNLYKLEYLSIIYNTKVNILIETSFYASSYPTNQTKIGNYISRFCNSNKICLPIKNEALDFKFQTQSLERTFIDKVFAVCDYFIANMADRDSRHLYDIAKIIKCVNLDDNLRKLIVEVRNDRKKSKNNPSANDIYDINDLLKEIIESRFYEFDYNNITRKLMYENYSYDDCINNGIRIVLNSKIF